MCGPSRHFQRAASMHRTFMTGDDVIRFTTFDFLSHIPTICEIVWEPARLCFFKRHKSLFALCLNSDFAFVGTQIHTQIHTIFQPSIVNSNLESFASCTLQVL